MVPNWLHLLAVGSLVLAGVCALVIAADEFRHPQKMWIMNVVWPINALYFGPVGLWAYFSIGRRATKESERQGHQEGGREDKKPFWQVVGVGVSHCGAGCTLGDIIAEWVVFWTGWTIAGIALWPEYILDFTLAYLLGVVFQFFAIAPMRGLGLKDGLVAAVKADTLSLTAFEVGLFGWMALTAFVFFPHPRLHPTEPTYWFMMQIGMILGFFTSYPVNVWLIKRGIKEAM